MTKVIVVVRRVFIDAKRIGPGALCKELDNAVRFLGRLLSFEHGVVSAQRLRLVLGVDLVKSSLARQALRQAFKSYY